MRKFELPEIKMTVVNSPSTNSIKDLADFLAKTATQK